jgi:protein CMS1
VPKSEAMASKANSQKRSLDGEGGDSPGKKKKQKKRKGGFEEEDSLLDTQAGLNTGIALMDPQLLADHMAQRTTKFGTDLSPVELSDLYVSRECPAWR